MSYNVCLKCKEWVSNFDKYCGLCQEKFGLPDDREFQRNWVPADYEAAVKAEVEKDLAGSQE